MYKRFIDNFNKININVSGEYDIPIIKKLNVNISDDCISYNLRKTKQTKGIHFFIDDYQFNALWNNPEKYISSLLNYDFVCSPDFSLYRDMPLSMQIWNHFKKMWLNAYFQKYGVNMIPTVSWSDERSYDFCFDGIPRGSIVAVSSVGCFNDEESLKYFIKGYYEMIFQINPGKIIFYGTVPEGIEKENIINIPAFQNKFQKGGVIND